MIVLRSIFQIVDGTCIYASRVSQRGGQSTDLPAMVNLPRSGRSVEIQCTFPSSASCSGEYSFRLNLENVSIVKTFQYGQDVDMSPIQPSGSSKKRMVVSAVFVKFSFTNVDKIPEETFPFYKLFSKDYQFGGILRKIFSYLEGNFLVETIGITNSYLRGILQEMNFGYQELNIAARKNGVRMGRILRDFPIQTVKIEFPPLECSSTKVLKATLQKIIENGTACNLRSSSSLLKLSIICSGLEVVNMKDFGDQIAALLKVFPHLERLEIEDNDSVPFLDTLTDDIDAKNLTYLKYSTARQVHSTVPLVPRVLVGIPHCCFGRFNFAHYNVLELVDEVKESDLKSLVVDKWSGDMHMVFRGVKVEQFYVRVCGGIELLVIHMGSGQREHENEIEEYSVGIWKIHPISILPAGCRLMLSVSVKWIPFGVIKHERHIELSKKHMWPMLMFRDFEHPDYLHHEEKMEEEGKSGRKQNQINQNELRVRDVAISFKLHSSELFESLYSDPGECKELVSRRIVINRNEFDRHFNGDIEYSCRFTGTKGLTWLFEIKQYASGKNFCFYLFNISHSDVVVDFTVAFNKYSDEFNEVLMQSGSGYGKISFDDYFSKNGDMPVNIFLRTKRVFLPNELARFKRERLEESRRALMNVKFGVYESVKFETFKVCPHDLFKTVFKEVVLHGFNWRFSFIENDLGISKFYIGGDHFTRNVLRIQVKFQILSDDKQDEERCETSKKTKSNEYVDGVNSFEMPQIFYYGGYSTGFSCVKLPEFTNYRRWMVSIRITGAFRSDFGAIEHFRMLWDSLPSGNGGGGKREKDEDEITITIKSKNRRNTIHSQNFTLLNLPHYVFFYPLGRDNLGEEEEKYNQQHNRHSKKRKKRISFNVFNDLSRRVPFRGAYTVSVVLDEEEGGDGAKRKKPKVVERTSVMENNRTLPFYNFCDADLKRDWQLKIRLKVEKIEL